MPKKEMPEAVTRKVTTAASRSRTSLTAAIVAPAKAPSSASPATASIRTGGAAATKAVAAPASRPSTT